MIIKTLTRKAKLLILSIFCWVGIQAQTTHLQPTAGTTTLTAPADFVDGDIYTDSGGSAGDYLLNELGTIEFCAPPGETVTINFTSFEVEASSILTCWDSLTVTGDTGGGDGTYSGDIIDAGAGLGCIDATDLVGNPTLCPFTSAPGGCLTFAFDSDGSVVTSGWIADISVTSGSAIPTLSQWGLIVLLLLLSIVGIVVMYNSKSKLITRTSVLLVFIFMGLASTYAQTKTYVSSNDAMEILSQEISRIGDMKSAQMTRNDHLMQDLTKQLMHEIDNGAKVGNAIDEMFLHLNNRKAEINLTEEEINSAKTHMLEMLEDT